MFDLLVLALLVTVVMSYAAFVMRVEEWLTLSALEAGLECPLAFLKNPNQFRTFRLIAFVIACIPLVWREGILAGTGAAILLWIFSRWLGRKIAFMTIRNRYRELLAQAETPIGPEDRNTYEKFVKMSDREYVRLMKFMQGKA